MTGLQLTSNGTRFRSQYSYKVFGHSFPSFDSSVGRAQDCNRIPNSYLDVAGSIPARRTVLNVFCMIFSRGHSVFRSKERSFALIRKREFASYHVSALSRGGGVFIDAHKLRRFDHYSFQPDFDHQPSSSLYPVFISAKSHTSLTRYGHALHMKSVAFTFGSESSDRCPIWPG